MFWRWGSVFEVLIILAIVIMLFGTGRLRGIGSILGNAVRDFATCWAIKSPVREHYPRPISDAVIALAASVTGIGRPDTGVAASINKGKYQHETARLPVSTGFCVRPNRRWCKMARRCSGALRAATLVDSSRSAPLHVDVAAKYAGHSGTPPRLG